MAVPFSNTKLRVPRGFQNILECLAKEVLRSQPENIFDFAAIYFEKLLKGREETGYDPAQHGATQEDRFYNDTGFQDDIAKRVKSSFEQQPAPDKDSFKTSADGNLAPSIPAKGCTNTVVATPPTQTAPASPPLIKQVDHLQPLLDKLNDAPPTTNNHTQPTSNHVIEEAPSAMEAPEEEEEIPALKEEEARLPSPKSEEVDIDLTDPDVEKAAVTIQSQFKGYKARKELVNKNEAPNGDAPAEIDIDLNDPETEKAAIKIQSQFRGFQTRKSMTASKEQVLADDEIVEITDIAVKKVVVDEEVIDIDLTDPEVEKAATKIQAGFKGFKARKQLAKAEEKDVAVEMEAEDEMKEQIVQAKSAEEEEVDIDLTDPEVEKAATKIQAGFKGFKARKQLAKDAAAPEGESEDKPAEDVTELQPENPDIDIDLNDPAVEEAATKIQASFRGFKARQEINIKSDEQEKVESNDTETEASAEPPAEGNPDEET